MIPLRGRLLILVLLGASLAVGGSTLSLLGRDGVSWLDVLVAASAASAAPMMAISLAWVVLLPFFGRHESAIPCLGAVPEPPPRLGIVVPVFKEDMQAVAARLITTWRSLTSAEPRLALHTRFFVLSDSPAEFEESERFVLDATAQRERLPLYYRRRAENRYAKPGNVHEFLSSPSAEGLAFIVGLDADSVMTGEAVSRLVRILSHPLNHDVAIVQSQMLVARPTSPLAAAEAWSRRHMAGAGDIVLSRFLGGGNYFGHNFIARPALLREASRRLLNQPVGGPFPGLRGYVASHDLAEGSILSDMGFRVLIDDVSAGSFEEMPPTLPLYLARESRWLRGSLQHVVGGWIQRGRLPQRFILCVCALRHLNCLVSSIGILASLLVLLRGDSFFGSVAPAWNSGTRRMEWSFTTLPFILLAITASAFVIPPIVSLWWGAYAPEKSLRWRFEQCARRIPGLVALMCFGLLVGPVISGKLAIAVVMAPFRLSTWSTQRQAVSYRLGDAVWHLSPLWITGCAISAFAAASSSTIWPFLLLLGLPLAIAPATAVWVSRREHPDGASFFSRFFA